MYVGWSYKLQVTALAPEFKTRIFSIIDEWGEEYFTLDLSPYRMQHEVVTSTGRVRDGESSQTIEIGKTSILTVHWLPEQVVVWIDHQLLSIHNTDTRILIPDEVDWSIECNEQVEVKLLEEKQITSSEHLITPLRTVQKEILVGLETELFVFDLTGKLIPVREMLARLPKMHAGGYLTDDGDQTLELVSLPEKIERVDEILANRNQLVDLISHEVEVQSFVLSSDLNISFPPAILNRIFDGVLHPVECSAVNYTFDPLENLEHKWDVNEFYKFHHISLKPERDYAIDAGVYRFLRYMLSKVQVPEFKLKSFQSDSLYYGEEASLWIRWRANQNGIEIKTNGLSEVHFDEFMRCFIPYVHQVILDYDPDKTPDVDPDFFRLYHSYGRFNIKYKQEDYSQFSAYTVINPAPLTDSLVRPRKFNLKDCFFARREFNVEHVQVYDHTRLMKLGDNWVSMLSLAES